MNVEGATISDELPYQETRDIVLPNQTENFYAQQIGGSLAKVVYFSRKPDSSKGGRLNFTKFETERIDECIDFIENLVSSRHSQVPKLREKIVVKATGGGAHKYFDKFTEKLKNVTIEKEDEMECLITGLNFLIAEIPYEVFTYSENDPMCFEDTLSSNMFPCILVNIGSGVSILKVTSPDKFERISGTSEETGIFHFIDQRVTQFDVCVSEMLEMSQRGDNTNVDMLVGDIYGSDYNKIGLKSTTIASSMGKVFKKNERQDGAIKALFLRHEGYLGAVGAFLKHRTRHRACSFSEILTFPQMITEGSVNAYGILESTPTKLVVFPKLHDLTNYNPDTAMLTDSVSQHYWIDVLEDNLQSLVELAIKWNSNGDDQKQDVQTRASTFDTLFRSHLTRLRDHPTMYGALTIRNLLNLREQCLHEIGFPDIFAKVKAGENKTALRDLKDLLEKVDSVQDVEGKIEFLIDNMLAGNMFDWGSSQTLEMLRKGELTFEAARKKIRKPEHLNKLRLFTERITSRAKPKLKKAVIFVDNSGADIVLGVIPFARFLISMDMDVILAANSFPAVNDVTFDELLEIMTEVSEMDTLLGIAWTNKKLSVMATGSSSPCLDLRRINDDLAEACKDVDFVLLEGMGRAIHTNYNARFSCDSLKIAVFKSTATALEFGVRLHDAMILYEEGS
ncbi:6555_t:CDS:10 [Acaulospora colombiana]|uniref:6555_t:CDS:1 n=1 Tax=Acaulospora colombiana TaxID=27376 RepID=A0ACA9JYI3_9GLOM|nr:6555_t:CDS:10 [Acaulospora colombiana]